MFKIFTDSSASLTDEMIEQHDLLVIPYVYILDGIEKPAYEVNKPFKHQEFYNSLREGKSISTSLINTEAYIKAFTPVLEAGKDVLYIGMAGTISSSMQAAYKAREQLSPLYPQQKIILIDTLAASMAEGLEVIKAAKMKAGGASIDEIEAAIKSDIPFINQYFVVDDLNFLKRGGRLTGTAAFIGALLNIKPVLYANKLGQIRLQSKGRGKRRTMDILVEKYKSMCMDRTVPVAISHADCEDDALYLAGKLREADCMAEILTVCFDAVTGSHVGPGAVAIFFKGKFREE